MQLKLSLSINTLLIILFSYVKGQYSPLQMCSSSQCDIAVIIVNSQYTLNLNTQFLSQYGPVFFCVRPRTISPGSDSQCDVGGTEIDYNCVKIFCQGPSDCNQIAKSYTTDSSLSNPNVTLKSTITSTVFKLTIYIPLTSLLPNPYTDTLFETVIGYRSDLALQSTTKYNYFHTYPTTPTAINNNLITQRQLQCVQFYSSSNYNYNLIFYGGVVRAGQNYLYFHIVSKNNNKKERLNMWGGLSFSTSHSSRDMIGFSSDGTIQDLYSLYFSAPFLDTYETINGTTDVTSLNNTIVYSATNPNNYYVSTSFYRLYDTGDARSDEVIRRKMNLQFCYAMAISLDTPYIYATDKSYPHLRVACWTPNIQIGEYFISALAAFLMICVLL